jgi:hypothetical protein
VTAACVLALSITALAQLPKETALQRETRMRWWTGARFGMFIRWGYSTDHNPPHVHVFQDGARILKFNIEGWSVMEGKMTPKARKALESLRREGVFDEKSET